jgi:hypothetical protein
MCHAATVVYISSNTRSYAVEIAIVSLTVFISQLNCWASLLSADDDFQLNVKNDIDLKRQRCMSWKL